MVAVAVAGQSADPQTRENSHGWQRQEAIAQHQPQCRQRVARWLHVVGESAHQDELKWKPIDYIELGGTVVA